MQTQEQKRQLLRQIEERSQHKFSRYVTVPRPERQRKLFPPRVFAAFHTHVAPIVVGAGGGAGSVVAGAAGAAAAGGNEDDEGGGVANSSSVHRLHDAGSNVTSSLHHHHHHRRLGSIHRISHNHSVAIDDPRMLHHSERTEDVLEGRIGGAHNTRLGGGIGAVDPRTGAAVTTQSGGGGMASSSSSAESSDEDDIELRAQIDAEEMLEQQIREKTGANLSSANRSCTELWHQFWHAATTEPKNAPSLRHSALFLLPPHMPLRIVAFNLIKTRVFEALILFFIILNCVLLAIEDQTVFGNEEESVRIYGIFENIFVGVFSAEMVLKICAFGFVGHKGSYLRDPWCSLDFFIMVLTYLNYVQGSGNFTALRSLRVLRPLRSLNAIPGLKILVRSFLASLRAMGPVALLSLMVVYVFSIVAVQLFSGLFRFSCVNDVNGDIIFELPCRNGTTVPTDGDYWGFSCPANHTCRDVGNPGQGYYSFDNVLVALLVVFSFSTFDGWTVALERAVGSIGVITFLFFGLCVMVVGILIPNLLLAVINLEYSKEQQRDTDMRRNYSQRVRQILSLKLNALSLRARGKRIAGITSSPTTNRANSSNFDTVDNNNNSPKQSFSNPLLFTGGRLGWNVPSPASTAVARKDGANVSPSLVSVDQQPPLQEPQPPMQQQHDENQPQQHQPQQQHQQSKRVSFKRNDDDRSNHSSSGDRQGNVSDIDVGSDEEQGEQEQEERQRLQPHDQDDKNRKRPTPLQPSLLDAAPSMTNENDNNSGASPSQSPSPNTQLQQQQRRHNREHPASPLKALAKSVKRWCALAPETLHQIDVWRDACHELTEGFPRSSAQAAAIHVSRSNTSLADSFSHSTETDTTHENDMEIVELRQAQENKDNRENFDVASGESSAQVDTGQIRSTWFTNLIVVMILLNTVLLASLHADQPDWLTSMQSIGNTFFTAIFAIEMCMRLFSIGVRAYVNSPFDLLDGFIVVSSVIELALDSGTSTFSVFRALRLLRVMKLLKQFPSLRSVVRVALYAIGDASYLLFIVLLYIFVFSLLGQALFNGVLKKPVTAVEIDRNAHTSFDSFVLSFYASFQILSMDLWVWVMYDVMAATHPLASLFFVVQIITGGFILISLFLSILVAAFRKLESRVGQNSGELADSSHNDALRERQNAFKHNMLDATLVQRVYRFGAQTRGHEFDKKGFATASLGLSSFLRLAHGGVVTNHLSAPMAKEYNRAKMHKDEEKRRLAQELKRRDSVTNVMFKVRNGGGASARDVLGGLGGGGGGLIETHHDGMLESLPGSDEDDDNDGEDPDSLRTRREMEDIDIIDLENLQVREEDEIFAEFGQSGAGMFAASMRRKSSIGGGLLQRRGSSDIHNHLRRNSSGTNMMNNSATNVPRFQRPSVAAMQSQSHQRGERRASLSARNLQEHNATVEEIAEIEKREVAHQHFVMLLERQRQLHRQQLLAEQQQGEEHQQQPQQKQPQQSSSSASPLPNSLELLQWQQRTSEATYRMFHHHREHRPFFFEDLSPDIVPARYMLRNQVIEYRKLRRANSANKFFAAAPIRSAIEETLRRVPTILGDHPPAPDDPPPVPKLPTCRVCGEELHYALPPAPLVAQPTPEVLHSLKCGRIRMRRARQKILTELLEVLDFYITSEEPPVLQKLDTLIAQAWEVDTMMTIHAEQFVNLPEPWHALVAEVKEELAVLDLRVGEDELGKSLIAQAFSTIPTQHQTNGGTSLFVFGPENTFRRYCSMIVSDSWFEAFILVCVLVSSALMAVANPLDDPNSTKARVSFVGSFVFTIIFAVEAALKIIAMGFYFVPTGAYIRDPWNVLDFGIVLVSLISDTQSDFNLSFLKVFRTLRATRALRVLRRAKGMKTVVFALVQNIKAIANVALLCLILLLIFAILAVQLYNGQFRYCSDPSITHSSNCTGYWFDPNAEPRNDTATLLFLNNSAFCNKSASDFNHNYNVTTPVPGSISTTAELRGYISGAVVPRVFRSDFQNFDNVLRALLTLFEITSAEGWMYVVWRATDTCDPNSQRDLNCKPEGGLFFVAFFAFSAFFLMQLFISFIIYNYEKVNRTVSGSEFLTAEQRIWISTQQLVSNFRPSVVVGPMEHVPLSRWLYHYVISRVYFDVIIALFILADVVILSLDHYSMSETFAEALDTGSTVVAFGFLTEALLKLTCFGLRYFRSSENRFDFFLVVIGILAWDSVGVELRFLVVLRVIRLSRILRLLRFAKGIQILLETLVFSLPSIANMGAFIILITFSFGVLGVDLFAKIYIPPNSWVLNDRFTNFRQLDSALMLLFRFLTLEDWVGVMLDTSIEAPTCATDDSCGGVMVPLYFCLYVIATSYIVLNLIMASMLVQFELTMALDDSNPKMAVLHRFVERWSEYDPDATMLMATKDIPRMLAKLGPPMGLLRAGSRLQILRKMGTFFIPEHAGQVHFMEVLLALEMGLSPPRENQDSDDADRMKREFFVMMTDNFPELDELPVQRIGNGRMITADLHFAQTYLAAAERRRRAYRDAQILLRQQAFKRRESGIKSLLLEGDEYFEEQEQREAAMRALAASRRDSLTGAAAGGGGAATNNNSTASPSANISRRPSIIMGVGGGGAFFGDRGIGTRVDSRMGSRLGSRSVRLTTADLVRKAHAASATSQQQQQAGSNNNNNPNFLLPSAKAAVDGDVGGGGGGSSAASSNSAQQQQPPLVHDKQQQQNASTNNKLFAPHHTSSERRVSFNDEPDTGAFEAVPIDGSAAGVVFDADVNSSNNSAAPVSVRNQQRSAAAAPEKPLYHSLPHEDDDDNNDADAVHEHDDLDEPPVSAPVRVAEKNNKPETTKKKSPSPERQQPQLKNALSPSNSSNGNNFAASMSGSNLLASSPVSSKPRGRVTINRNRVKEHALRMQQSGVIGEDDEAQEDGQQLQEASSSAAAVAAVPAQQLQQQQQPTSAESANNKKHVTFKGAGTAIRAAQRFRSSAGNTVLLRPSTRSQAIMDSASNSGSDSGFNTTLNSLVSEVIDSRSGLQTPQQRRSQQRSRQGTASSGGSGGSGSAGVVPLSPEKIDTRKAQQEEEVLGAEDDDVIEHDDVDEINNVSSNNNSNYSGTTALFIRPSRSSAQSSARVTASSSSPRRAPAESHEASKVDGGVGERVAQNPAGESQVLSPTSLSVITMRARRQQT